MQRLALLVSLVSLLTVYGVRGDDNSNAVAAERFSESELSLLSSFGPWPQEIPPDSGNELSGFGWAEAIGARLFNDPDLSGDTTLSCATCHQHTRGFSDALPVAVGASVHVRNTQGLENVGLQRWFGWDGGADSLWAATLRPMLSDIEMAGDIDTLATRLRNKRYVMEAFDEADRTRDVRLLGNEELVVLTSKTIAAYTRTLMSARTPFDDFRDALLNGDAVAMSAYPVSARRGLKIFFGEANCHVCHFGPNFSNGEFHDTGRSFFTGVGQVDPGRYSGIKRMRLDRYNLTGEYNGVNDTKQTRKTRSVKLDQTNFGQWRTPSLRNLSQTAPYMHDGSITTLRDVIDAYADIDPTRLHTDGESLLKPLPLTSSEREDLVTFLESLSTQSR